MRAMAGFDTETDEAICAQDAGPVYRRALTQMTPTVLDGVLHLIDGLRREKQREIALLDSCRRAVLFEQAKREMGR